ncbi:MAG: recombination mediator RecR [Chlamydiota bacterium]
MQKYPQAFEELLHYLRKMPGVGRKTAEKFAFHILQWQKSDLSRFSSSLEKVRSTLRPCTKCGALQEETCLFCSDSSREKHTLCIVASARDIFLVEESRAFRGQYHAIEKLLSPIEGIDESFLRLEALTQRMQSEPIQEVIFALESTVEGDATTLFLKEFLERFSVTTSRLALGIPMGLSLEYTDGGTLAQAVTQRRSF